MIKFKLHYVLIPLFILLMSCNHSKVYKIGVSQCSDDDWRSKMNAEIQREMMFHPEAIVEIRSADDNSEKQISDIKYFIDNHFDIIIAAPNEAEALTPIISDAYNKGIPIVLFDRNIVGDNFTAWQGADNLSIGKAAGEYAVDIAGKNAPIIEIYGLQGSTPADERHEGFNIVEGINVVARGYGNWNYKDAFRVADSLLVLHPETRLVFAHNDRMAIAASDASRKRGLSPYIIGIDAAPEIGMKAVADSVIDATFIYPTEGQMLVKTALSILNGEPYDKITTIPTLPVVNNSNVKILLSQNENIKTETKRMELLKTQVDEYWAQHSSQKSIIYAILAISLLLFGFLFMVLRSFWVNRRYQAKLIKQYNLLEDERDKQKNLIEKLDAATSSKLAFFTGVSHDLRTPLTLIAEPIEQISAHEELSEKSQTMMGIAKKNLNILRRLINEILDFRKYENGKLMAYLTESNLTAYIKDWASSFTALAAKRNIKFELFLNDNDVIETAIDVEKIERVFYNLVSNAFKYTPDGGAITIRCNKDHNDVILIVEDTGCGIPENDLPNIFDRFFQGTKIHPTGTGIGLALAKAFVELHNGKINVESKQNLGTKFTVTIPIQHISTNEVKIGEPIFEFTPPYFAKY